jgi:hypothetical protein
LDLLNYQGAAAELERCPRGDEESGRDALTAHSVRTVRRLKILEHQHPFTEDELSVAIGHLRITRDDVAPLPTDEDDGLLEGEKVGGLIVAENRERELLHE